MIPPLSVRLRRDFRVILGLIMANAMLHQATRDRDESGRIIATLDDYQFVRALVANYVAEGVEATVSPVLRETVKAVKSLQETATGGVRIVDVATALGIDKSSAKRRVDAAIAKGFVINTQEKRGRPANLIADDPLPDEQELLPTVEALSGCTVAVDSEG